MVKFTEVIEHRGAQFVGSTTDTYGFRDIYVNPEHIVMVREDVHFNNQTSPQLKNKSFTKLVVNRGSSTYETTVVGTVSEIYENINNRRSLLKG